MKQTTRVRQQSAGKNMKQTTRVQDRPGYDSPAIVDVISLAELPGGYHFEAEIEGQRFLAMVPPGGLSGVGRVRADSKM